MIIHPEGIILTNRHVVEDSQEVIVQLFDGREYKAQDVRSDDQTDLAVVRIVPEGPLPAARLGDSDQLEIGDWVIAIGHPFELEQTVSAGIISRQGARSQCWFSVPGSCRQTQQSTRAILVVPW